MIGALTQLVLQLLAVFIAWRFGLDPDAGGYRDSFRNPANGSVAIDKVAHLFGGATLVALGVLAGVSPAGSAGATLVTLVAYELQQRYPRGARVRGFASWRDVVAGSVGALALAGWALAWAPAPQRTPRPRVITREVYVAAAAVDSAKAVVRIAEQRSAVAVATARPVHQRATAAIAALPLEARTPTVQLADSALRLDSLALDAQAKTIGAQRVALVAFDTLVAAQARVADSIAAEIPVAERRGYVRGLKQGAAVGSGLALVVALILAL